MDNNPRQDPPREGISQEQDSSLRSLSMPRRIGAEERRQRILWALEKRAENILNRLQEFGEIRRDLSAPLLASLLSFGFHNPERRKSYVQEGERLTEGDIFINLRAWKLNDLASTKSHIACHLEALQQLGVLGSKGGRSKLQDKLGLVSDVSLRDLIARLRKTLAFQLPPRSKEATSPPPPPRLPKPVTSRIIIDADRIARAAERRRIQTLETLSSQCHTLERHLSTLLKDGPEILTRLSRVMRFWIGAPTEIWYDTEFPQVRDQMNSISLRGDPLTVQRRMVNFFRSIESSTVGTARIQSKKLLTSLRGELSIVRDGLAVMTSAGLLSRQERTLTNIILGALEMFCNFEIAPLFGHKNRVATEPLEVMTMFGVISMLSSPTSPLMVFSQRQAILLKEALDRVKLGSDATVPATFLTPSAGDLLRALKELHRLPDIRIETPLTPQPFLRSLTGEDAFKSGMARIELSHEIYLRTHFIYSLVMLASLTIESSETNPESVQILLRKITNKSYGKENGPGTDTLPLPTGNPLDNEDFKALHQSLIAHLERTVAQGQ